MRVDDVDVALAELGLERDLVGEEALQVFEEWAPGNDLDRLLLARVVAPHEPRLARAAHAERLHARARGDAGAGGVQVWERRSMQTLAESVKSVAGTRAGAHCHLETGAEGRAPGAGALSERRV